MPNILKGLLIALRLRKPDPKPKQLSDWEMDDIARASAINQGQVVPRGMVAREQPAESLIGMRFFMDEDCSPWDSPKPGVEVIDEASGWVRYKWLSGYAAGQTGALNRETFLYAYKPTKARP